MRLFDTVEVMFSSAPSAIYDKIWDNQERLGLIATKRLVYKVSCVVSVADVVALEL